MKLIRSTLYNEAYTLNQRSKCGV